MKLSDLTTIGGFEFAIDERIIEAARSGAIFALNLSGGKDSTMVSHAANSILDRLGHPRDHRCTIHADLGRAEWRSTPETVERQAAQIGLPLAVVRREAGDMVARWEQRYEQGLALYERLELVRLRSPWSAASLRFCTSEMKRDVLHRYLASTYPGQTIVSVLGIRHQESPGRSKTPISKVDSKLQRANGTNGILWHPAIRLTTDDVFAYHAKHKLCLHEAYSVHRASRLSCAYCVIGSLSDLRISAGVPGNQPLYRLLVSIEARTGFSFQQNRWLADIAPQLLDVQTHLKIAAAKAYAHERRALEGRVSTNFLKAPKDRRWPWRMPDPQECQAIAEARRLNSRWTGENLPFLTPSAVRDRFAEMISAKGG